MPGWQGRPDAGNCRLAGRTVLVIDDEEDVRSIVRQVLERRGARVLLAADGPSGIRVFETHAGVVDVVLLDMGMPQMSGRRVAEELIRLQPGVRIVVTSGGVTEEMSSGWGGPNIAGYAAKPYLPDALVAKLVGALV